MITTAGAGGANPETFMGKGSSMSFPAPLRERESEGRPCAVAGLEGGPLEPCVQVRARLGRWRRVDGRFGIVSVKRGVLGDSISSPSPE